MSYYAKTFSPIGDIFIQSDGTNITRVNMSNQKYAPDIQEDWIENPDLKPISLAVEQLAAYFAGNLRKFDLPLILQGTPFQKRAWTELTKIPFGTIVSYGELARRLGNPNASRAVGLANGKNPIAIIVPCHRVIGSNGSLTGFGGGLPRKQYLLEMELSQEHNFAGSDPNIVRGIRKWSNQNQEPYLL